MLLMIKDPDASGFTRREDLDRPLGRAYEGPTGGLYLHLSDGRLQPFKVAAPLEPPQVKPPGNNDHEDDGA